MNNIKAVDATLHLIAKHLWRGLQPLRFLNPLGFSKLNDAAQRFAARCYRIPQGRPTQRARARFYLPIRTDLPARNSSLFTFKCCLS